MRVLFSTSPLAGHLLPMAPLAQAARLAGHDVAVLTSSSLSPYVDGLPLLPVGPPHDVLLAEAVQRLGAAGTTAPGFAPATVAFMFAGVRVDLTISDALAAAQDFAPDLIVCEAADQVGPLVAAILGVPWASHAVTIALPDAFDEAMVAEVASRYAARSVTPTARVALLDHWPEELQPQGWVAADDRIALRPQPYGVEDAGQPSAAEGPAARFPSREDLPLVLITLGTVFGDLATLERIVASVISRQDVNVVVTLGAVGDPATFDTDRSRVAPVGFVPLAQLLPGVDVVVAAGAGTVLGALSSGLPVVLVPMIAEQHFIAARLATSGAAVVAGAPDEVGEAVHAVLAGRSHRQAAVTVAERMRDRHPPYEALRILLGKTEPSSRLPEPAVAASEPSPGSVP